MAKPYEMTTAKRVVSSLMAVAARMGLGNFAVLTTTGHKSGTRRAVTVAPIREGDVEYLVSPYGDSAWVRNARAHPEASLRRGREERRVRLVEVTGHKAALVKRYHEREAFARQFMDVPGDATEADFAAVPERFPIFRVDHSG